MTSADDLSVVHVGLEATRWRIGGLNRYFESLVRAQRGLGMTATGVVLGDRDDEGDDGIISVAATGSLLRRSRRIDRAVRRRGAIDVADVHFAGTGFVTTVFGALRRVPFVVHFQGPWAKESVTAGASGLNVALKGAMEKMVYRRAARFVVLSSSFASVLTKDYGIAPWSIEVLAPGVDLAVFATGDQATARTALGAPSGRVVVTARRLVPRMGLEVLLRAWSELNPTDEDLLSIVGDGSEGPALREVATSLGIEATVRFCGRVDDATLVAWYQAADLTVVPSVSLEGFGLVVLESLACGTPVVGTDADGLREALAMAHASTPATPGDPLGLAAEMRRALEVPRTAQSTAQHRAIAERHGWSDVARQHARLYERLLDDRPVPRVVVLDHTAALSGGELAIARALEGVRGRADVHAILAVDGPLRSRLEAAGATCEVLALDDATRNVRRADVKAATLRPRALFGSLVYVARLARRLRALRPDVVHTNSLKSALYGGVAAKLARVPCVWHVRDRIESPYLPPPAVKLVQFLARVLPSGVVANSASTLETVGVTGGVVIPSPLDPSISPPTKSRPPHESVRITVLGRLAEWKGQDLAIRAFAAAFPSGHATLTIAGSALFGEEAYADSLPRLADTLGVGDRVDFRGFVEDVATLLEATDVVVHSSLLPEPFGQVVVEAMGAGCAVVVANDGGPAELVVDGVNGLLYTRGDEAALVASMQRVAEDAELRSALGVAAVETASHYTVTALAPRLLAVWEDAEASRRHRRRSSRAHG